MQRKHAWGFGVLACLWIGVHAHAVQAETAREGVDAGNRAFMAAFLRGDARAISELYTEDAQVIAPGAPVAKGRPAIAAHWKQAIDSGIQEVRLTTGDVETSGDLAAETGTAELVAKDGSVSRARYVVVWKRQAGAWRLHRDIFNSE